MSYSEADKELFRQILMEHYNNPRNKGLIDNEGYLTVHLKNPSCGDDLTIQVRFEGDRLADIRQEGTGCAICCSSASVMSERLAGLEIPEAETVIQAFKDLVSGEGCDEDLLEDATAFQGVADLPPRIKCATLAWLACEEAIKEKKHEH